MNNKRPKIALIYDFDGTLSPKNMQEYGFISDINIKKDKFWRQNKELANNNDANQILCYMYLMIKNAKSNDIPLKRETFKKYGANIELFSGVKEWFGRINSYGQSIGVEVKHYINSSGLKEMIEGTEIAKEFENIYACTFLYDVNGVACWPAVAVDYTTKTQFLFKINKGIKEISDTVKINEYVAEEDRPIPFKHMIYFGDGTTDIPCMKMIKINGGFSIAVYGDNKKKETALKLIDENRANFVCKADYSENAELFKVVKRILDKMKAENDFERLLNVHKIKGKKI